jgi:uncharacterized protein YjiS (DUF1127 family)
MGTVTSFTPSIRTPDISTDFLHKWLTAFSNWQKSRREAAELAAMSDYQLKDIGLTRYDLYRDLRSPRPTV